MTGCQRMMRVSRMVIESLYDEELERVMLLPENEEYDPIYPNELYIQGVAVNVIKKL